MMTLHRRLTATTATAALLLALAACSSGPSTTDPAPAPTSTDAAAAPTSVDRTAELQQVAGDQVLKAVETEPGRIEVSTSIVDPRGDDGSAEAQAAIAICQAAVGLGATYVSVLEEDGSTFVLYGHPTYGDVCTEV